MSAPHADLLARLRAVDPTLGKMVERNSITLDDLTVEDGIAIHLAGTIDGASFDISQRTGTRLRKDLREIIEASKATPDADFLSDAPPYGCDDDEACEVCQ